MIRSTILCGAIAGVESRAVHVEARVAEGLPGFDIVGLPERAVRESQARVRAAIAATGIELPARRYVINLAPGDVRKAGSGFDLAIAVAVLAAAGLLEMSDPETVFLAGELSLRGEIRPVAGVLAHLRMARERKVGAAVVPAANGVEAALVAGHEVVCASDLRSVLDFLSGVAPLDSPVVGDAPLLSSPIDFCDVRGQGAAKRVLAIAAAGGHHVLLSGPPGAGKSMLARRLPTLLPPPSADEMLAIATIASVAGLDARAIPGRPFRAPHHHATAQALIGGGQPVCPGEITLAHGGVLFLDELPEFRRDAIEALRVAMETKEAVVVRAAQKVTMPAGAQIVAAMNPCPCGYAGDAERVCRCAPGVVERYRGRVSAPLLDRFDLQVAVSRIKPHAMRMPPVGETSAEIRARVVGARATLAGELSFNDLVRIVERSALDLLDRAMENLKLSARGYSKVLRVARTIAALGDRKDVQAADVAEAIQYRVLDRDPIRTAA